MTALIKGMGAGGGSLETNFDLEDHDLTSLVYQATSQIPGEWSPPTGRSPGPGRYQGGARGRNDSVRAPNTIVVPCHRIVYNDGNVGWYSGKRCGKERRNLFSGRKGSTSVGARWSNFPVHLFQDFDIEPLLTKMRLRQEELRTRLVTENDFEGPSAFIGLDVAYHGNEGFAVRVVQDAKSGQSSAVAFTIATFFSPMSRLTSLTVAMLKEKALGGPMWG